MSYLVLHVRPWEMPDEDTGEVRSGISLQYMDLSDTQLEGEVGLPVLNISADKDLLPAFTKAPGLYDLNFVQRRGAKGKARIVLTGAKLQKAVNFGSAQQSNS